MKDVVSFCFGLVAGMKMFKLALCCLQFVRVRCIIVTTYVLRSDLICMSWTFLLGAGRWFETGLEISQTDKTGHLKQEAGHSAAIKLDILRSNVTF